MKAYCCQTIQACPLTFNSRHIAPQPEKYGCNAGHGSVFEINDNYYLIYHIGQGTRTSFTRSSYISQLAFYKSGHIKQIGAPEFVNVSDPHVGTFKDCL